LKIKQTIFCEKYEQMIQVGYKNEMVYQASREVGSRGETMECPKCKNPMQRGFIVAGELGVRFCDDVPFIRVACGDVIVKSGWGVTSTSGYRCRICRLILYDY
jgi:hypothetical protein